MCLVLREEVGGTTSLRRLRLSVIFRGVNLFSSSLKDLLRDL